MKKRSAELLEQQIEQKATEPGPLAPLVEVANALSKQDPAPPQAASAVERGRRAFLAEAAQLRQKRAGQSAGSQASGTRWGSWRERIRRPVGQRAWGAPLRLAWTAAVVLLLLSGIVGGIVAASQQVGPTSPLYTIKLRSEEVRMTFTTKPRERVELALYFSGRRVEEAITATVADQAVPEVVLTRLDELLRSALDDTRLLPEGEMRQALEQFRATLQLQAQALEKVKTQSREQFRPSLERTRSLLAEADECAQLGLADPSAFRQAGSTGPLLPPVGTLTPTATPVPSTRVAPTATRTPSPAFRSTPTAPSVSPHASSTPPRDTPVIWTSTPAAQPTSYAGQTPGRGQTTPIAQTPGPVLTPHSTDVPGPSNPPETSPGPNNPPGPPDTPGPTRGQHP